MKQKNAKNTKSLWPQGLGGFGFLLFTIPALAAAASDPASLDRLHDIVTPPPVSWWPPPPGWYVGSALLLLILLLLLIRSVSRYRANAYRRAALRELAELEQANRWQELPALLKRVALSAFPRTEVASLAGESWIAWLNQHGSGIEFSSRSARLLSGESYNPDSMNTLPTEQGRETTATVRNWIRSHSSRD